MTTTRTWFITGSSRGLGRNLTEGLLERGNRVVATARNIDQLQPLVDKYPGLIYPISLDVTNTPAIHAAVTEAIAHFGRIDVLVNNAGFGIMGAVEAFTDEQVRSQLETNLYAPIEVTRAVLPHMRRQRSGHILQVSSIGGRITSVGLSIYQTAKFGLSGFSEALSKEVAPLGIKVTAIEPGGFRTDWGGSSMSFAPQVEGYETSVDQRIAFMKSGTYVPVGDPDKAARVMIDLVDQPEPPVHLVLGSEAVALLNKSETIKKAELEKWLSVSLSTDFKG